MNTQTSPLPLGGAGGGSGTPATAPTAVETLVIVRNFQPGQAIKIVVLNCEQAKSLPAVPPNALTLVLFPGGQS
jgi:hypothetical protein